MPTSQLEERSIHQSVYQSIRVLIRQPEGHSIYQTFDKPIAIHDASSQSSKNQIHQTLSHAINAPIMLSACKSCHQRANYATSMPIMVAAAHYAMSVPSISNSPLIMQPPPEIKPSACRSMRSARQSCHRPAESPHASSFSGQEGGGVGRLGCSRRAVSSDPATALLQGVVLHEDEGGEASEKRGPNTPPSLSIGKE